MDRPLGRVSIEKHVSDFWRRHCKFIFFHIFAMGVAPTNVIEKNLRAGYLIFGFLHRITGSRGFYLTKTHSKSLSFTSNNYEIT